MCCLLSHSIYSWLQKLNVYMPHGREEVLIYSPKFNTLKGLTRFITSLIQGLGRISSSFCVNQLVGHASLPKPLISEFTSYRGSIQKFFSSAFIMCNVVYFAALKGKKIKAHEIIILYTCFLCARACVYMCACACVCVFVYECMHVCVCVCVCIPISTFDPVDLLL
jgi:hypothetical protein